MSLLGLAIFLVAVAATNAGLITGLGTKAIISGPSGTVIRGGLGLGHLGAGAIIAPGVGAGAIIAPGVVAPGLLAPGLLLAGHEGQYIPDHSELLYDDGSYKPYLYGH